MIKPPFQFKIDRRRGGAAGLARIARPTEKAEPETITPVQGIMPDSVQEWRLATALERLKKPFDYQVPIAGGHWTRGGLVIDFVVYDPHPIPCPMNGDYWHGTRSAQQDRLENEIMEQWYGVPPVIFWEHEVTSVDAAVAVARRKLG